MAERCRDYLPEECWELIFNRMTQQPIDFEPLSLVCKKFLFLTNRLRTKLSVIDPTVLVHRRISSLVERFPHLKSIDLSGFHGDLDNLLLGLTNCSLSGLEELYISNCDVVPTKGLAALGRSSLRCLKVLKCCKAEVFTNFDLVNIANSFPCLEELDFSNPMMNILNIVFEASKFSVTDEGIRVLATSLKNLRRINMSGNHFVSDTSLGFLSGSCRELERVVLDDCPRVTFNGVLSLLSNSDSLVSVSVSDKLVPDSFPRVEHWVGCGRGFSTLELYNCVLSDEFLRMLSKANPQLRKLWIIDCSNFTLSALSLLLSSLESIQELGLSQLDFLTDECMERLSRGFRNMVRIVFFECIRLTTSTFYTLARNCPLLEYIEIVCSDLGKEDGIVEPAKGASILSVNVARNHFLTRDCAKSIALACPNLETLDLSSCSGLLEEGITEILDTCRGIKHLRIENSLRITRIGNGPELPNLERLDAKNTAMSDEGLATVGRRCPRLLKLDLEGCGGVTTRGVEELVRQCNMLREISLKNCQNVDGNLDRMVLSRPSSLRKIIPPCYSSFTESRKRFYLQHGCQVCE